VEILAVCAVIVGLGLIKLDKTFLSALSNAVTRWFQRVTDFLVHFTISDLLGIAAVVGGIVVVVWRVRFHLLRSEYWRVRQCPRCGSSLHRIHRNLLDRVVGLLILPHSRRFRCDNPDCRWTGLRYGRHHMEAGSL